jgi:hypothetical protein
MILFLVAFARQTAPPTMPVSATTRQVKKAAVIAIVARALMMVAGVLSYIVYVAAVRTYGKAGSMQVLVLRDLLFELPALIVPWIVYRGIRGETPTRIT